MINSLDEAIKHCEEVAEERQKKADMFKSLKDFDNPKSTIKHGYEDCLECAKEHRQLAKWLRELKTKQTSWIPCSVRLPEKNGNYLVTVEANDGTASIIFQMVDHYGPDWLHEGKREKVIAWMPLPEPYKTESEDKE